MSATLRPRRSTMTRSQTSNTSGMRWLIRTIRDALVAEAADQVEHFRDLAHADGGGRLVHQHDLGSERRVRAIATAWRWPPDMLRTRSRGRVSDLSSANSSAALAYMRVSRKRNGPRRSELAAEEDVGRGGEIVAEREVLVDDLDALLARLHRLVEMQRLAVDHDFAGRRREVAGDDLHDRRFAGAVASSRSTSVSAWIAPKSLGDSTQEQRHL